MKIPIAALLLVAFIVPIHGQQASPDKAAASAAPAPAPNFKTLTREEFEKLLAKPGQLLIIDVRRPDEVQSIGGFPVYLSIQAADVEKSLAWIPKDRTIVAISNHVSRSGRTAELLASKGFKVAGAIGAQTYEEAGGKLLKIAPKAATPATPAAGAAAKD